MPAEALSAYAEARTLLEVAPWAGDPYHRENPDGPIRTLPFGSSAAVVYLILECRRLTRSGPGCPCGDLMIGGCGAGATLLSYMDRIG